MHPILIEIGDFFIGTYGLMIALGLLAAIFLASFRGKRRRYDPNLFFDLAFIAVVSGFVFARLFFIMLHPGEFARDPMALLFSRSGFVFLGGFVGAVGCMLAYLSWKKLPILDIGDIAVPSLAIGHGIGRIGCHLAGCCWGGVCTVSGIGIQVRPQEMPGGEPFVNAYTDQFFRGMIPMDAEYSLPVWPVQLMEAGGLILLAGVLVWLAARGPHRAGTMLGIYLIAYPVMRFLLEFLRGDAERGLWFGDTISTSQILSLLIVPVGVWLLVRTRGQEPSPRSHPSTAKDLPLIPPPKDEGGKGRKKPARKR